MGLIHSRVGMADRSSSYPTEGGEFLRWLRLRLKHPLPGFSPEGRFSPRPVKGRNYAEPIPNAKPAAVLVLLHLKNGAWHLPCVVRPWTMPTHAGQVGLPGGTIRPNEPSQVAALREYQEELGADPAEVELLGSLTPIYVHSSGYCIRPWVGFTSHSPIFNINTREVARLLEVPLADLLDCRNFGHQQRSHLGEIYESPHFQIAEHQIWGATCVILGELVLLVEEYQEMTNQGLVTH